MADGLDQQHEDRDRKPDRHGHTRVLVPEELLQISDTVLPEAVRMVIDEGTDSAAEWNHRRSGGRLKTRNEAQQVRKKNEKAQRHQEWGERLAVMADDFVALVLNEAMDTFEHVLQSTRFLD